jgi:hypothetical protein
VSDFNHSLAFAVALLMCLGCGLAHIARHVIQRASTFVS